MKLKKNELKSMRVNDLKSRLLELKKELLNLRSKASSGASMESPGMIKSVKRNIARIHTQLKMAKEEKKTKA